MSLTLGVRPCKGSGWTNDLYMIKMISGYGTVTIQDNGEYYYISDDDFLALDKAMLASKQVNENGEDTSAASDSSSESGSEN